jgi:hypothetical protein
MVTMVTFNVYWHCKRLQNGYKWLHPVTKKEAKKPLQIENIYKLYLVHPLEVRLF